MTDRIFILAEQFTDDFKLIPRSHIHLDWEVPIYELAAVELMFNHMPYKLIDHLIRDRWHLDITHAHQMMEMYSLSIKFVASIDVTYDLADAPEPFGYKIYYGTPYHTSGTGYTVKENSNNVAAHGETLHREYVDVLRQTAAFPQRLVEGKHFL